MKKVLFAMLVSGMLFSCTNNTHSEEQAADSTVQLNESTLVPVEEEITEPVEVEVSSDTVAVDSSTVKIQ
jgi:uncharacterized protein YcfL